MRVLDEDGRPLSRAQEDRYLDMVRKDAQEYAGQFYDQCRSKKFRLAWAEVGLRTGRDPQMCFVDGQWTHFIEHVKELYCEMLQSPKIAVADKEKINLAVKVLTTRGMESQNVPIQVKPGTQQFIGEKYENKQIESTFGAHAEASLLTKLMRTTAVKLH